METFTFTNEQNFEPNVKGVLRVFRYEDSQETITQYADPTKPIIFLAGPTVRGHQPHLTSWRFAAVDIFKELQFDGSIIIPEFVSRVESDKGKKWIPLWEYEGLKRANVILFWIPRTRELIALTTNWEQGYWIGREIEKVIYGRPDDAYRIGYLDTMWEKITEEAEPDDNDEFLHDPNIYNNLYDTIGASIIKAKELHKKYSIFSDCI